MNFILGPGILFLGILGDVALACGSSRNYMYDSGLSRRSTAQIPMGESTLTINKIPFSTRAYWMRQANLALPSPCPFAAFGTVIVNHTDSASGLGELICTGANSGSTTGNPTMHGSSWREQNVALRRGSDEVQYILTMESGEMAAISNCSSILTDPKGPYNLTATEAAAAFADLSLYTNAESCPMCASAIRWAGFREYIYGTSIDRLIEKGWGQIRISSLDIFQQSFDLPYQSRLIAEVLTNETDPYFLWQYDPSYPCPKGCARSGGSCAAFS